MTEKNLNIKKNIKILILKINVLILKIKILILKIYIGCDFIYFYANIRILKESCEIKLYKVVKSMHPINNYKSKIKYWNWTQKVYKFLSNLKFILVVRKNYKNNTIIKITVTINYPTCSTILKFGLIVNKLFACRERVRPALQWMSNLKENYTILRIFELF